jgi:hypothetical protein
MYLVYSIFIRSLRQAQSTNKKTGLQSNIIFTLSSAISFDKLRLRIKKQETKLLLLCLVYAFFIRSLRQAQSTNKKTGLQSNIIFTLSSAISFDKLRLRKKIRIKITNPVSRLLYFYSFTSTSSVYE